MIRIVIDGKSPTTRALITRILEKGKAGGESLRVAAGLVGARLAMICKNGKLVSDDESSKTHVCFMVNDSVFYVSVSAGARGCGKCRENLRQRKRVFWLAPESLLASAQAELESELGKSATRVSVVSIESFIALGVNLDGAFSSVGISHTLARLLELYNRRARVTLQMPLISLSHSS